MATEVYTVQEIKLQDESTVLLRPLNIKGLRKFHERMDEFVDVETNNEGMDVLLDCAAICLMKIRPSLWDKDKDRGFFREDSEGKAEPKPVGGASEEAEDVLDMPTVYRILDVCAGVKLDDPNLLAAATAALGQTSTSQD